MQAVRLAVVILHDSNRISHFLLLVENIVINTTVLPSGRDDVDSEQCPELIRAFDGAKCFREAGVRVTDILCALRLAVWGRTTDIIRFPALRNLHVQDPMPIVGLLWDAT